MAEGDGRGMYFIVRRMLVVALIAGSACAGGCYHIKGSGPVTPPTGFTFNPGSPTPTPSGECEGQSSNAAIVEVSPDILPTKDPTYGVVGEYALAPPSGGVPRRAAIIRLPSATQVQFANVDTAVNDSAVGLGTTAFPAIPHTFPSGTQNPTGTTIGSNTWSTGRLGAAGSFACFSRVFTLPTVGTGQSLTAYFGDFDLYNLGPGPYRNVIVVAGAAQPMRVPVHLQPIKQH